MEPTKQQLKREVLKKEYERLERTVTEYAQSVSPVSGIWLKDIIRTLKRILCNTDLRQWLGSQISVTSMQKLIALDKQDPTFGDSLLRGLTKLETQRLLPLVEYVEKQSSEPVPTHTYTTLDPTAFKDFQEELLKITRGIYNK
jgi:hypothetical protein